MTSSFHWSDDPRGPEQVCGPTMAALSGSALAFCFGSSVARQSVAAVAVALRQKRGFRIAIGVDVVIDP